MKELCSTLFIILIFSACAVNYENVNLDKKIFFDKDMNNLAKEIDNLSEKIDKKEAKDASYEAIRYSKYLANKYEIVKPALFHNTLVNLKLKEKGYCYHYANDLMAYLQEQNFKSFYFLKVIANKNEYFEHTSIILTRDDVSFENSIVLDAWRNSGKLFFAKVKDDKRYKWEKKGVKINE